MKRNSHIPRVAQSRNTPPTASSRACQTLHERGNPVAAHLAAGLVVRCHVIELHAVALTNERTMAVPRGRTIRKYQQCAIDRGDLDGEILQVMGALQQAPATFPP